MIKFFASAVILAGANAATNWWMDNVEFDGINNADTQSRYWLRGKYGPNNMGWFGVYAYIYLEVGGAEIPDGSVVTTWAELIEPDLPIYEYTYDDSGNIAS